MISYSHLRVGIFPSVDVKHREASWYTTSGAPSPSCRRGGRINLDK